jgi:PAS domain-containing protein
MPGHEWPGRDDATSDPIDDRAPRRHRELIAALEWLPVASLILADDGTVLAANQAWSDLVGASSASASDQGRSGGWLSAVWPADAEALRARLQRAAADGRTGSADVRLTGASRPQSSRWWWRAGPAGYLIVCAGESSGPAPAAEGREVPGQVSSVPRLEPAGPPAAAGGRPTAAGGREPGDAAIAGTLSLVVHRLFGVGLGVQALTSRADDITAQRLQHILDELDSLIRDVRTAAFSLGRPIHRR